MAPSTQSNSEDSPASCPAVRGSPRCAAQRPLPSITIATWPDRKSTRLNSSHANISYAVFCLKKKNNSLLNSAQATLKLLLMWSYIHVLADLRAHLTSYVDMQPNHHRPHLALW